MNDTPGVRSSAAAFAFATVIACAGCSSDESHGAAATPLEHDGAAPDSAAPVNGDASVTAHVVLPAAPPGIGFDDLEFAPTIRKILAPAGRSGNLDLVD